MTLMELVGPWSAHPPTAHVWELALLALLVVWVATVVYLTRTGAQS